MLSVIKLPQGIFFYILFIFLTHAFSDAQQPSFVKKSKQKDTDPSRHNLVTLGIEPSFIFPVALLSPSSLRAENPNHRVNFSLSPQVSWRAGLSIRYDMFRVRKASLSNQFSLVTGLFYNQRRWIAKVERREESGRLVTVGRSPLRFISYEWPVMLLLNLRASETMWFGAGTGVGVEFFPSQAYVPDEAATNPPQDGYWLCYMARKNLFVPAFKMQFGAEWRTERAGYFYAGISFQQPLPRMADVYWRTDVGNLSVHPYPDALHPAGNPDVSMRVSGAWFAIDVRYFFRPSREGKSSGPQQ